MKRKAAKEWRVVEGYNSRAELLGYYVIRGKSNDPYQVEFDQHGCYLLKSAAEESCEYNNTNDAKYVRRLNLSAQLVQFGPRPKKLKLKTRIHFNRVNMQRKDPRIWSAKNSRSCNMSEKIEIWHEGVKIAETVYNPEGKQPRAYVLVHGMVRQADGVTVVDV